MLSHEDNENCCCTTCFMDRVKTTRKYVNKAMAREKLDIVKMGTIEGTKFEENISPWCICTTCYMNKADAIAKTVMTKQANVKTEGTKFEDDGEDGCYIDYRDLHEKMYDKPIPLEGSVFKYPYNNGLAYDKHLELNSFSGTDGLEKDRGDTINPNLTITINPPLPNQGTAYYVKNEQIRTFNSGATRDTSEGKIDFEGFISPIVLEEFGKYMLKHQKQSNGELRPSDNWQKGMPRDVYMKSAWRHFHDWWMEHRGYDSREGMRDALNGLLFNLMGYMYELLKEENKNISKSEYKEELFY